MKVLTKLGWQDIPATKETGSYKITLDNGDSFQVNGDVEMFVVTNKINSNLDRRETDMIKVSDLKIGQRLINGLLPTATFDMTKATGVNQIYNLMLGPKPTVKMKIRVDNFNDPMDGQKIMEIKVNKEELIMYGANLLHSNSLEKSRFDDIWKHIYSISPNVHYVLDHLYSRLPESPSQADLKKVFSNLDNAWMIKAISMILIGLTSDNSFNTHDLPDGKSQISLDFIIPSAAYSNNHVKILLECMKYICNFESNDITVSKIISGCKIISINGFTNISKFLMAVGRKDHYAMYSLYPPIHNYSYEIDRETTHRIKTLKMANTLFCYPIITNVEKIDVENNDDMVAYGLSITPAIRESDIGHKLGCPKNHIRANLIDKKIINGYWGNF